MVDVLNVTCWISLATAATSHGSLCASCHLEVSTTFLLKILAFTGLFPIVSSICWMQLLKCCSRFDESFCLTVVRCASVLRRDFPSTRGQESLSDLRSTMAQVTSEGPEELPTKGPLCACRGPTLGTRLQGCRLFWCYAQVFRRSLNSSLMGLGLEDWISTSLCMFWLSCTPANHVVPTRQASGQRSLRPDQARTADTPESRV